MSARARRISRKTFLALSAAAPLLAAGALPRGLTALQLPFELLANGIFLPVSVNGQGPFPFAIDTGAASSIVAAEFVAALGLTISGRGSASGEGSDSTPLDRIAQVTFGLPQATTIVTAGAASVPMAALWPLVGRRFYGALGYDVLRAFVVEIDYGNRVLTLHDPIAYRYTGGGTLYDATLWDGYDPQVEGALLVAGRAPVAVKLTLDTGGGGTVVSAPVVEDYQLVSAVGKTIALPDHGIGNGESRPLTTRLRALQMGTYSLDAPLVALSQDGVGAFASRSISVDAGGDVLRRFTITLDYPNRRVWLEPNRYFGEPFAADASGLVLAAEGADFRTFVVTEIVASSPAARAGMAAGDVITAIDGEAASSLALFALQDRLKQSGRTVRLAIRRNGAPMTVPLDLQALI